MITLMTSRKFLIAIAGLILISLGCEQNETAEEIIVKTLTITYNSDAYIVINYTGEQVINYKDFSGENLKISSFEYNDENVLIGMYVSDGDKETHQIFNYSDDNIISEIQVLEVIDGIEKEIEIKTLEYNSSGYLIKINTYLPETFSYVDSRTFKYGYVKKGVWTENIFLLDDYSNPLSQIGLPPITPETILEHNIVSSTAQWTEYYDCMGINDTTCIDQIKHSDMIYTSIFEYNENQLPIVEYRNKDGAVDTVRYFYD